MPAKSRKNRILGYAVVPGRKVKPHPDNARKHPAAQKRALQSVLDQLGIGDAIVVMVAGVATPKEARSAYDEAVKTGEWPELTILDGHLRKQISGAAKVPCLITDYTESESAAVLLSHDSITEMAKWDLPKMDALSEAAMWNIPDDLSDHIRSMRDGATTEVSFTANNSDPEDFEDQYGVIVICENEAEQKATYERLMDLKYNCKVMVT